MTFCPTGVSTVVTPQYANSPVTVSLTGLDPDDGVIRVIGSTEVYISFGNGDIRLSNEPEFFKVPDGITSLNVSTSSANTKVGVTIGKFV